jgi:23S rRNA (uracil1939-C5)-methyltransferase
VPSATLLPRSRVRTPPDGEPERLELTIDSLAAGGDGVGRAADGRVVFVPFTAPGDRVCVRVTRAHSRFARARVESLRVPGPRRSDPPCAAFGECGGCTWQHLEYAAQVEAKRQILRDALRRLGHLEIPGPVPITPSPSAYGYRIRARVLVRGGRVGYRRARSHAPCAVTRCPVLAPALEAKLTELAARPPSADGEWELFLGTGGVRAWEVSKRPKRRRPGPRALLAVAGERIGVSPGVFTQANGLLLEPLAGAVLEAAGAGTLALEVFAGAGFLTLALARRFDRVVAIESDPAAAADLASNLRHARIDRVQVRRARLEAEIAGGALDGLRPEALVLDPPRTGLPAGAAAFLAGLRAPRVVYLSCDPATLARDLAEWVDRGYRLARVEGFDLFPQTPHLEVLAGLERAEPSPGGTPPGRG